MGFWSKSYYMNIKNLVDRIISESDVNPDEYTVVSRLEDIHQTRMELAALTRMAGTDVQTETEQTETLVAGDQIFAKSYRHADLIRVEYKPIGSMVSQYRCLDRRVDCTGRGCTVALGQMAYTEDSGNVYIWDGFVGDLKFTYTDDQIVEWVESDYDDEIAEATELKEVYQKLLFLAQVVRHAGYYSKERYEQLSIEHDSLFSLFKKDLGYDTDGSFTMRGNGVKIT